MATPDPVDHLPLRPTDLHLLLALAQKDLHGYALVQAIETATNGLIRLDPGNLYRVIKRLLADGLVAESERRASSESGAERRRYYRLTAPWRVRLGRVEEPFTEESGRLSADLRGRADTDAATT